MFTIIVLIRQILFSSSKQTNLDFVLQKCRFIDSVGEIRLLQFKSALEWLVSIARNWWLEGMLVPQYFDSLSNLGKYSIIRDENAYTLYFGKNRFRYVSSMLWDSFISIEDYIINRETMLYTNNKLGDIFHRRNRFHHREWEKEKDTEHGFWRLLSRMRMEEEKCAISRIILI